MTGFPIAEISRLSEKESWRKEINRPIYHIHKWWAQRLGSVFRAILIYLLKTKDEDTWRMFYQKNNFSKVVFDPFMGSGTTLGEALKMGNRVIGCDINPISSFLVRQELTHIPREKLFAYFSELERSVAPEIEKYYKTLDPKTNVEVNALYYFWVKVATLPTGESVPLFSSYVFAKNAYASKKPAAQIICPSCWGIFPDKYDVTKAICPLCGHSFNPQEGPVHGAYIHSSLGAKYKIKDLLPEGKRFEERLFSILILTESGEKKYIKPSQYDLDLYKQAAEALNNSELPLPQMAVRSGYNTDQARGYNYLLWKDFFNARQLLCLGKLLQGILLIPEDTIREQFLCLFSSTLEFNNMFCSYKGEGTGAVRPIFSNHILKPERVPLENTVWGTEKSSGCFSTLFKTRFLAAKNYLEKPFELKFTDALASNCQKVSIGEHIDATLTTSWRDFNSNKWNALILCGDSAKMPIPDACVDMVVTDPPYFDYIHYSELSDFFYAWLSPILKSKYPEFDGETSGRKNEVQQTDPITFSSLLSGVFAECYRVMKDSAKLSFSFHHSRPEGWVAIADAIIKAGFYIEEAFPVHAELMASTPKTGTKEPISLDTILICTKRKQNKGIAHGLAEHYMNLLRSSGKSLSRSDVFVIYAAQSVVDCVNSKMSTEQILGILESDLKRSSTANDDELMAIKDDANNVVQLSFSGMKLSV